MEPKYDVIGVGSCCVDYILTVDDVMRLETIDSKGTDKKYVAIEYSSKLNVKTMKMYPGGSAPNMLCDLSNMGMRTMFIGCIGSDVAGEVSLGDLVKHRVDVSSVKKIDGEHTAHSIILITPWGRDRSILAYKGASDHLTSADIREDAIKSSRCVCWTSLTNIDAVNAMEKCIDVGRAHGSLIAAAPSISIIKLCKDSAERLMKKSDIVSLNDEELIALTGNSDLEHAIKILLGWGLKLVNVTLGRFGGIITDGVKMIRTKPPIVVVNDTTGAGDASMAGVIWGYLNKLPIDEIARVAATLSAMEIQTVGVRIGMPESDKEMRSFMETHPMQQEALPWPSGHLTIC